MKKWSGTMRGKFKYSYSSWEGKKERKEYKRSGARIASRERYKQVRGTPDEQRYYPKRHNAERFRTPYSYDKYKTEQRIKKRIKRLLEGKAKKGLEMRCDCGKTVSTCIHDIDELPIFTDLLGDLCKLHI